MRTKNWKRKWEVIYDLNLSVPNISASKYSDYEKFYLLKNYLYELNECLSFALSNIDYSNLKENIKNKIEEKSEEKISYENLIKENKN